MSTLDTYTQEQLDTRKERAPEYIQQLLDSKEFAQTLYKTGEEANLQVDEIGFLFEEVVAMLLGITSPEQFRKKIDAEFSISSEEIDGIVTKLNETVFVPLREAITKKEEQVIEEKHEPKQFENSFANNSAASEVLEQASHMDEPVANQVPEEVPRKNTYTIDPYREPIE